MCVVCGSNIQFNLILNMFKKHLESLSVLFTVCFVCFVPLIAYPIIILFLYVGSYPRFFAIAYLIHLYFDWDSKNDDSRHSDWMVRSKYIKLVWSYFSMSMEAEVEIPQDKNYIIGMHPHGVICFGVFAHYNEDDKNYKKIFGNGKSAFCTAHYNLEMPFQRDYFFQLKGINASANSILNWLSKKDVCHSACLYIGGAEEALLASPEVHTVILKKRKGFCRLAIKAGANLVPSYTFGENALWDTVKVKENSIIYKMQRLVYKYLNLGLPLLKGRGKYHYMLVMPHRVKVTQVFGRPVEVQQSDNPTREEVDELHGRYCNALKTLFDSHKHKYLGDKNAQLIIQ